MSNLKEAIRKGLMIGPLKEVDQRIEAHVRDYLSHKFQVKIIKTKEDNSKVLVELWKEITGEEI